MRRKKQLKAFHHFKRPRISPRSLRILSYDEVDSSLKVKFMNGDDDKLSHKLSSLII